MPQFVVTYDVQRKGINGKSRRITRVTANDLNDADDKIRERAKAEKWAQLKIVSTKRASIQDNDPRKGTF